MGFEKLLCISYVGFMGGTDIVFVYSPKKKKKFLSDTDRFVCRLHKVSIWCSEISENYYNIVFCVFFLFFFHHLLPNGTRIRDDNAYMCIAIKMNQSISIRCSTGIDFTKAHPNVLMQSK